jgi:hypothetical protein
MSIPHFHSCEISVRRWQKGRIPTPLTWRNTQEVFRGGARHSAEGEPITAELLKKIKGNILDLAQALFEADPYFKKLPAVKHLPNAFLFRYAISGYVVTLRRIKEGGANGASAEKIRNDLVDAIIAAYATYFDGFSSEDQKATAIHETTCDLLKHFHEEIKAFAGNQQNAGNAVVQERQAAIS